jgi:elongation factor G
MSADPGGKEPAARRRVRSIRNLGIMAHIDAGKTTLTERLLYVAGRTHRMGEVHDGAAVMDWMDLERERGITITSAVTSFGWRGHELHLIDTPGHVDFTIEVERSLRVLDGAIAVFDAVNGVEPQSEAVWRQADRWGVPRIAFANKMDRPGADFAATLASMRARFPDHHVAPVHRPLGAGPGFEGLEDLVARRTLRFGDPDDPRAFTATEGLSAEGEQARAALVETLAEADDEVAAVFLDDGDLGEDALRAAVRRATVAGRFVPLLCGAALRNKGVPQVLDAVCDWLPSPLDVPPPAAADPATGVEVRHPPDDHAPLVALAFKVSLLDEKRRHVFLRLYSGRIAEGDALWNAALGREEKVSRVLLMHASQKQRVPELGAGQICAVTGLKETRTGDTLSRRDRPLVLAGIPAYEPVLSQAIEAATQRERDALLEALTRIADEDPSFRFQESGETGEILISGMGELHLDVVAERVRREFGLAVRTGQPQVLLRETVAAEATAEATFDRVVEGAPAYGHVAVRLAPLPRGSGLRIAIAPGALPAHRADELRPLVEAGARAGASAGVLEGGWPMEDVAITVTAAHWREGASHGFAYEAAAADAVRAAAARAGPFALEPVVRLELLTPGEHVGEVLTALERRGGVVLDVSERGAAAKAIASEAPLRSMFGFATELRSATQGRAVFTMRFDRFDAVGRTGP